MPLLGDYDAWFETKPEAKVPKVTYFDSGLGTHHEVPFEEAAVGQIAERVTKKRQFNAI